MGEQELNLQEIKELKKYKVGDKREIITIAFIHVGEDEKLVVEVDLTNHNISTDADSAIVSPIPLDNFHIKRAGEFDEEELEIKNVWFIETETYLSCEAYKRVHKYLKEHNYKITKYKDYYNSMLEIEEEDY